MTKLLRRLSRLAFRRGVIGGSREWAFVWVAAALWSRARRKSDEPAPVIHREVLGPGESIRISVYDPRSLR
ncbi:MAG TPA: hypothetical protein VGL92_17745 [Acidimicrobiia bacterium]|jgi:hypothetical protein